MRLDTERSRFQMILHGFLSLSRNLAVVEPNHCSRQDFSWQAELVRLALLFSNAVFLLTQSRL